MILIPLVFLSALILEILGSFMSVVGLSAKTSYILMILAIALDFSKVVLASVLYKNWKGLNILFKLFLVPSTVFLMTITSFGSYSYLLQSFSQTTASQEEMKIQLQSDEQQQQTLQQRKEQINAQIAKVPDAFVSQKKRLNDMFKNELDSINQKLASLNNEIPELKINIINTRNHGGTLGSLAHTWNTTPENAAKILALMMAAFLDPLAIVMLMVGTFLEVEYENKKERKEAKEEAKKFELEKLKLQSNASSSPIQYQEPISTKTPSPLEKEKITQQEETVQEQKSQISPIPIEPSLQETQNPSNFVEFSNNSQEEEIKKDIKNKNIWEETDPFSKWSKEKVLSNFDENAVDPFNHPIENVNDILNEIEPSSTGFETMKNIPKENLF
jgi:hypothetical protein